MKNKHRIEHLERRVTNLDLQITQLLMRRPIPLPDAPQYSPPFHEPVYGPTEPWDEGIPTAVELDKLRESDDAQAQSFKNSMFKGEQLKSVVLQDLEPGAMYE